MNSLAFSRTTFCNSNMDMSYEPIESANADLDNFYSGSHLTLTRYCMPYLDHSYAAGLPTVPYSESGGHVLTPSLLLSEPLSFVDINAPLSTPSRRDLSTPKSVPAPHILKQRTARHKSMPLVVNGPKGVASKKDVKKDDPYAGSVTRCICDYLHDDGYMICCDRCGVWQHVECMGVNKSRIPESYLCELCYPRLVDKRRAIRIQSKKKDENVDDSISGDSDDDRPLKKRQSRKKSSTSKNRSSIDDRRKKRNSSELDDTLSDLDMSGAKRCKFGIEEKSEGNSYSVEVKSRLLVKMKGLSSAAQNQDLDLYMVKEQLEKQRFTVVNYGISYKGIEATDTIKQNQAIAEYTGNISLRQEYERKNHRHLSYPFTVCYMGINGLELCIDSRKTDNMAKYVRTCCMPNAKVIHILEKTGLRFIICATKNISIGKEITIPFYFDYQRSDVKVHCPCGKSNCLINKRATSLGNSAFSPLPSEQLPMPMTDLMTGRSMRQIRRKIQDPEFEFEAEMPTPRRSGVFESPAGSPGEAGDDGSKKVKEKKRRISKDMMVTSPSAQENLLSNLPISKDINEDIALLNQLSQADFASVLDSLPSHIDMADMMLDNSKVDITDRLMDLKEVNSNKDPNIDRLGGDLPIEESKFLTKETEKTTNNLASLAASNSTNIAHTDKVDKVTNNRGKKRLGEAQKLLQELDTPIRSSILKEGNNNKKTREQKKIEEAEKIFQKFEGKISKNGKDQITDAKRYTRGNIEKPKPVEEKVVDTVPLKRGRKPKSQQTEIKITAPLRTTRQQAEKIVEQPVKKTMTKKETVKKEAVKKETVKKETVKKETVKKEPVKRIKTTKMMSEQEIVAFATSRSTRSRK